MTRHLVTRVRYETRLRTAEVTAVERITPKMARITVAGAALDGFVSTGFDDHVKLFFPAPGEALVLPALGPGVPQPAAPLSPMRDFTPRRLGDRELVLDFALHEAGPATEWATLAKPGDQLGIGGPRGSFVVPDDFDWELLIGDETALPAIGRRLEELSARSRAIVVAAVAGPEEQQVFESLARVEVHWVHRPLSAAADPKPLLDAVAALTLPDGEGYAWVACESATAKLLRQHLVGERGLPKASVKAAGYWRPGRADFHESHDD